MTRCNYLIYSRCTTCQINYDKGSYGDTCPDCHRRLRTISHGSRKTRGKVKRIWILYFCNNIYLCLFYYILSKCCPRERGINLRIGNSLLFLSFVYLSWISNNNFTSVFEMFGHNDSCFAWWVPRIQTYTFQRVLRNWNIF